jgi:hypothetical protein
MNKTSISVLALVVGMIIGGMLTGLVSKEATLGGVTIEDETFKGTVTVEGDTTVEDIEIGGTISGGLDTTTALTGATTITADQSGTTFVISGTGATYTLPAVTNDGFKARFVIGGAFSTNAVIDSAEGDNVEGTLIVAGAVVDCASVDQINFVADGENIGDFVDVYSDGTQWLIGASGVLTSAKATCTDPS